MLTVFGRRQVVRDHLRPTKVSLESTGEFCHLQADDGAIQLATMAVLLVVLSGNIQPARQTADSSRQRGSGDLSRWLQRHLAVDWRQRRLQHSGGSAKRLQLREQPSFAGECMVWDPRYPHKQWRREGVCCPGQTQRL